MPFARTSLSAQPGGVRTSCKRRGPFTPAILNVQSGAMLAEATLAGELSGSTGTGVNSIEETAGRFDGSSESKTTRPAIDDPEDVRTIRSATSLSLTTTGTAANSPS